MTSEIRTLVDLSDIAGVEIECRECSAKIVYPRKKNQERMAKQCPNCNSNLFTIGQDGQSDSMNHIKALMKIIDFIATPGADLHAKVRLHVDAKI